MSPREIRAVDLDAPADPQELPHPSHLQFSPYRVFSREEWARLRADTPMTLVARELEQLSGLIEDLSVSEVEQIYLPPLVSSTCMSRPHRSCTPSPRASSDAEMVACPISLASPARWPSVRAPRGAC
jgi:hypothetical protein